MGEVYKWKRAMREEGGQMRRVELGDLCSGTRRGSDVPPRGSGGVSGGMPMGEEVETG